MTVAACGSDDGSGGGGGDGGDGPIVIGFVHGFTGSSGRLAELERNVLESRAKVINDEGGIDGRSIEIKSYDSQTKPDVAVRQTQRAITEDGAVAIIGPQSSTEALATGQVTETSGVVQVNNAAATPSVTEDKQFIFRTAPLAPDLAKGMLAVAEEQGAKRVGLLYDDTAFGQATRPLVEEAAKVSGIELTDIVEYPLGASSVTNEVSRVARGNPEAVLVAGATGAEHGLIAKAMTQQGVDVPLIGLSPISEPDAYEVSAGAFDRLPGVYTVNAVDTTKESVEQFQVDYKEEIEGDQPTEQLLGAYDALEFIVEGLKETGGEGGEALAKALEDLPPRDGLNGAAGTKQEFTADQHDALSGDYLIPYRSDGADFVQVEDLQLDIAGN